jgi:hypothetical protein
LRRNEQHGSIVALEVRVLKSYVTKGQEAEENYKTRNKKKIER